MGRPDLPVATNPEFQGKPQWLRRFDPAGPEPLRGSPTRGHQRPYGREALTDTELSGHPVPVSTDHVPRRGDSPSRPGRLVPRDKSMAHECAPRQPLRNRERPPHLPIAENQPTGTRQWCGYLPRPQASDVFPGEVPPHVPLILVDLLWGQRNSQVCPQALVPRRRQRPDGHRSETTLIARTPGADSLPFGDQDGTRRHD